MSEVPLHLGFPSAFKGACPSKHTAGRRDAGLRVQELRMMVSGEKMGHTSWVRVTTVQGVCRAAKDLARHQGSGFRMQR